MHVYILFRFITKKCDNIIKKIKYVCENNLLLPLLNLPKGQLTILKGF